MCPKSVRLLSSYWSACFLPTPCLPLDLSGVGFTLILSSGLRAAGANALGFIPAGSLAAESGMSLTPAPQVVLCINICRYLDAPEGD